MDDPGRITTPLGEYDQFDTFVAENPRLDFLHFDPCVSGWLSLFALPSDFDFGTLESRLKAIEATVPAMLRIFRKPLIHLRETDDLMPIETVRKISSKSVSYASSHSSTWDKSDGCGITPRKLMTEKYEDDYSIYENLVFVHTVDLALKYLGSNMRLLSGLLYRSNRIELNLLDRAHHLNYFSTIGRLYTGYVRHFGEIYEGSDLLYLRMKKMSGTIRSGLKYPVYRNNVGKAEDIGLHNTNILTMNKDYRRVFSLLKRFDRIGGEIPAITERDKELFAVSYFRFCVILLVFSAVGFDFTCEDDTVIDFDDIDITMVRRGYRMSVRRERSGILLTFDKGRKYSILLVPLGADHRPSSDPYAECFNETIYLSPDHDEKDCLTVSVSDVDSFRRMQNVMLRGEIMSDASFDQCPFCIRDLKLEEEGVFVCRSCMTEIRRELCPTAGRYYITSGLSGYKLAGAPENRSDSASLLYYRSITPLTRQGFKICPLCKKVHI